MEPDLALPRVKAKLRNGLTVMLDGRGRVLALRTPAGLVRCVDPRGYTAIHRKSREVEAWVEVCPHDVAPAERKRLVGRALRSWRVKIAGDRLEEDRARLRALKAAALRRLEARSETLKRAA
jgi:hypothetical protein